MIHYSFTKKIGILKGWSFPNFFNEDIKINFQTMIFYSSFLLTLAWVCSLKLSTVW